MRPPVASLSDKRKNHEKKYECEGNDVEQGCGDTRRQLGLVVDAAALAHVARPVGVWWRRGGGLRLLQRRTLLLLPEQIGGARV